MIETLRSLTGCSYEEGLGGSNPLFNKVENVKFFSILNTYSKI